MYLFTKNSILMTGKTKKNMDVVLGRLNNMPLTDTC